jgi:L-aminopeptidase/D-esterase-like protein
VTGLRDMPGFTVGHWTNEIARTGCTVLAFDRAARSAVEVRGAAPGSRELDCLAPGRLEQHADAILLTGGSAFGLAAADGVMRELATQGRGYRTAAGVVPIVPSAVIYDLAHGEPIAPSAEGGRTALLAAVPLSAVSQGRVGAGTGASWDKFSGSPQPGGIGIGQTPLGHHLVTAVVVLNAMGSVRDLAPDRRHEMLRGSRPRHAVREATTLIAVVTSHPCGHGTLTRMCVAAHDALARTVIPAHTMFDGDIAFAATLEDGEANTEISLQLSLATELAVEAAIVRAARPDR